MECFISSRDVFALCRLAQHKEPGTCVVRVEASPLLCRQEGTTAAPAETATGLERQRIDSRIRCRGGNSSNVMDRGIGFAIGRRLGWPVDETDRQSAELHRLQAAMTIGLSQRADILIASCPEIRKELDVLRRRATLGEIDAAKEAAATEPVSEEERDRQTEFKRENRERREAEEGALEANRQTPELLLPVKQ